MNELKSKHLWPLVEQSATTDTSDPENTIPGWVALAMLDDLRRLRVNDLAAHWPDLEDVPEGRDLFAQYPVAGLPDGETLSRLCCDANLTGDDGND
jgi:hypothetical protein